MSERWWLMMTEDKRWLDVKLSDAEVLAEMGTEALLAELVRRKAVAVSTDNSWSTVDYG